MATTEEIILRVKADNTEALQQMAAQKQIIDQLRTSTRDLESTNKDLKKEMSELAKQGKSNTDEYKALETQVKANTTTIAANGEAVKAANKEIAQNSKTIQDGIKYQKENTDSVLALRAQLSMMKQEYYSLSKAERENAEVGGALQKQINEVTDEVKAAEEGIQVYSRSVGNYEGAINSALGTNKGFIGQITAMQAQAKATGQTFGGVFVQGVKSVGSALKALLANPIVLTLAAIVAVITALTKAIKGNEEQSRKLEVAMAPLNRALEFFKSLLQGAADGLIAVIGWLSKAAGGVSKFMEKLPFVGKYIAEANEATEKAIQLEKDKQTLTDRTRQNTLEQAKTEKEVADLRAEMAQKDKYSAQERIDMANKAADLEKAQAEENIKIAEEKLRIAQEEAKYNKNSKEVNEDLINLEAEVIRQQTALSNQLRTIEKQRQTAIKEVQAEEKAAADARLKAAEEYRKKVEDGAKQLRTLTLDLMAEGAEKEKQIRTDQYNEALANVQGTEEQKNEIRKLLAEQYQRDIADIEQKYSQEELDRAVEAKTEELNIMLELAKGDADKQLEIRLQQWEMEKQAAIEAAEEKGVAVELVEQQFEQRKAEIEAEQEEAKKTQQAEALQAYLEQLNEQYVQELEQIGENEQAKADLQLQIEQEKLNALLTMTEENRADMFESEEAYQAKVREQIKLTDKAQKESENQAKAARVTALKDAQDKMDSLNSVAGSIADLFNQIGGDNEEMQAFLKATALFQIGVDMAKAIAGAVAGAMDVGFPACIPALAAALAAVTAGIIQAKQTLSKQKEVSSPTFATGGLVTGAGTGTSDSIPAMLSNGESVINARSTAAFAPLLSAINQAGGGVPISMERTATQAFENDFFADSIAAAMAQMPNPIVAVSEIDTVKSRVTVNETLRNR